MHRHGKQLILRTTLFYSNRGVNFVLTILRLAREQKELAVVDDQIGSPTWARALADSTAELLRKITLPTVQSGIYHLSAQGYTTRFNFAKRILEIAREMSRDAVGAPILRPITSAEYPLLAARPLNAAASKDKVKRVFGIEMTEREYQLRSYLNDMFAARGDKPMGDAVPQSV